MDNSSMPPVQPMSEAPQMGSDPNAGQPMQPAQPMQPVQPIQPAGNMQPMPGQPMQAVPGMPMVQQIQLPPEPPKKDIAGLIKTIVIIIVSLIAVTFIGLFVWMYNEYHNVSDDVQGQIDEAVAVAKDEQWQADQAEFTELEKYPYKTFSGPADYGELSFKYPKTWSVYIAAAATTGGDFNAYFNPIQVDAVGKETINALRVTIRNKSFDDVSAEYQKAMDKKGSDLTVQSVTVNGTTANRYSGTIPNTELQGFIVIFKIRDKTAILQTDSVLFEDEFNKLLETVIFNA